jgi:transposase
MDVSKTKIQVATLFPGEASAVETGLVNEGAAVRRMVRRIQRKAPGAIMFCYEAGPCGYALQRQIEGLGLVCVVVAPSKIPTMPGDRIKTDRRDARKLAELLRAGLLTVVRAPTPAEEAARDLCRAREVLKKDCHRCRQRIAKLLLRRGHVYPQGGNAWTLQYRRWLRSLEWDNAIDKIVVSDYVLALEQVEGRLKELESRLSELAQAEPFREKVGWLACFRGVKAITAMTILTELHGPGRFSSARGVMAFLGMVPSEYSSGEVVSRGRITGAGNGHVRRVLIEAAQNYRTGPSVRGDLLKRREGQPGWVIAMADRAQQRLHRRFWRLSQKGKPHNKIVVAIARELAGFFWAVLQGPPMTESVQVSR